MDIVEYTTTRHNPGIDPHMHIWEWQIPLYLFLGGIVAGIMVLAGYRLLADRVGPDEPHGKVAWPWAPLLGVVLLSLGMGALFLDLQHRWHVYRLYMTFQVTSPMSWGSWILLLVYPAMIGAAVLHPPHRLPFGQGLLKHLDRASAWMHQRPRVIVGLGVANLFGGIALGIYTGILLGSLGARPLWSSALLGPLFLLSGLSTAAALLHLLGMITEKKDGGLWEFCDVFVATVFRLVGDRRGPLTLVHLDTSFLSLELATLLLFLLGLTTGSAAHQEAARMLLTGAWAPAFWCGVVFTGILVPMLLQGLEMTGRIAHSMVPAVLVLGGGFLLRWVMVFAGQASHW